MRKENLFQSLTLIVLAVFFSACGGSPATPAPTSTRPPAQATPAPAATRGATAIPTATLAPFGTINAPTAMPSPLPTSARASAPTRPAAAPATAQPAPPVATGGLVITLQSSGYETWGRPAGMDDKAKGCGSFNDARPVSKFNLSIRVTNTTAKDISANDWYAYMQKGDGKQAYVCYYGYTGGSAFPSIPAGQSRDVTFAAFIERGEFIRSAYVRATDAGASNILGF